MEYIVAYGLPTIVLLGVLIYAVSTAGWLSPRRKANLEAATRATQRSEDPQK